MKNMQRVGGQEAHTARGEAECCMVPRDPTPSVSVMAAYIIIDVDQGEGDSLPFENIPHPI